MKTCPKCGIKKPLNCFNKRTRAVDGLQWDCKECGRVRLKVWGLENKDEITRRRKARESSLPDQKKEARYKRQQEWVSANKDYVSERAKEWYLANKEKAKANRQAWYRKNKKEHSRKGTEYSRNLRKNDPEFLMLCRLRNRIRAAFHCRGMKKTIKSLDLVGCSKEQLMAHIQSLFKPGMNWNNRSLWHIDHIRPCKSFNLLDPEEQKKCFNYTNLQPLWAVENLEKSSKYDTAKTD